MAECNIPNCRKYAPAGEAFCVDHRERPWPAEPDPQMVHRVCRLLRTLEGRPDGACEECPATESYRGKPGCTRGCYLIAAEFVNTVETGNPWRKTELSARARRMGFVVLR
jgi:hypothetical protein